MLSSSVLRLLFLLWNPQNNWHGTHFSYLLLNCNGEGCWTRNQYQYIHVWRHSVMVVASIKYPLQIEHIIYGVSSDSLIIRCKQKIIVLNTTKHLWESCIKYQKTFARKLKTAITYILKFLLLNSLQKTAKQIWKGSIYWKAETKILFSVAVLMTIQDERGHHFKINLGEMQNMHFKE